MALEGTGVKLEVRPVSSLLPHEETIPSHVELIMRELRHDGVQRDPILVDKESGAVLDGMHRLAAFARLGIGNVICYPLDYTSKSVEIHRWARVFTSGGAADAGRRLAEAGLTRETGLSEAFELLEVRGCGLAAFASGRVLVPERATSLEEAFETVRALDAAAEAAGWRREFVPDDEIDVPLQARGAVVLLVEKVGKDDVVRAARSARLFPCKTSMHSVDPRPVGVNFPIAELGGLTSSKLRSRMAERRTRVLPPNSFYEGRRYKERLLLVSPR